MTFENIHYFDEETHTYYCLTSDHCGHRFLGQAICAEEDREFESSIIGYNIATARAQAKALKFCKDVVQAELNGLKHYHSVIRRSKKFKQKGYEAKMLYRQINIKKDMINALKEEITQLNTDLDKYINEKEQFHQRIREKRQKDKN